MATNPTDTPATPPPAASLWKFTGKEWLIIIVAIIGFAFDIYELLMLPMIQGPALAELLQVPQDHPSIRDWFVTINTSAAVCGGVFGLLGGWLIDKFGRKKILVASILIYGFSPVAAAYSTTPEQLLFFRCTTFIGVCVEFVAAVSWLAELFPDKKKRELVLGFTQAFSSFGGLMLAGAQSLIISYQDSLPRLSLPLPFDGNAVWRYVLISGLIPAIPILFLLPFLPESPVWKAKKLAGQLKRPSFGELFQPAYRKTTIVCTILFACAYGVAFGAIQLTQGQIAPGVPEMRPVAKELAPLNEKAKAQYAIFDKSAPDSAERKAAAAELETILQKKKEISKPLEAYTTKVQFIQEMGGLTGRIIFAGLALVIASRVSQLRFFVFPALLVIPLYYWKFSLQGADMLLIGIYITGLLTVAQYSFWGNYLPAAYPLHLRGTAGGFTANVGGRMIGGSMGLMTNFIVIRRILKPMLPEGTPNPYLTTYGCAIVAGVLLLIASIAVFFLPEPKSEE